MSIAVISALQFPQNVQFPFLRPGQNPFGMYQMTPGMFLMPGMMMPPLASSMHQMQMHALHSGRPVAPDISKQDQKLEPQNLVQTGTEMSSFMFKLFKPPYDSLWKAPFDLGYVPYQYMVLRDAPKLIDLMSGYAAGDPDVLKTVDAAQHGEVSNSYTAGLDTATMDRPVRSLQQLAPLIADVSPMIGAYIPIVNQVAPVLNQIAPMLPMINNVASMAGYSNPMLQLL
jgi:hypothetical protein